MQQDDTQGMGVSADADRATRASTEPASGLGPDGRVSTDADCTHDMDGAVIYLDHPAEPMVRKLSDKQARMLDAVCRTNGGGVSLYEWPKTTARGLMARHFIQGKAGHPGHIVHTREGLAFWRSNREADRG